MTYTTTQIAAFTEAHIIGTAEHRIAFLLTDSRSLFFPDETLFFALRTARNDGHRYLDELYRRGVRSFVVSDVPADYAEHYADAVFLQTPDTLKALQQLAARHRSLFHIPVAGITGSNGKTVVKEWLYRLLSPERVVTRSPKSYNSQTGVPLSVWLMNDSTEAALIEAGISQPGEMDALQAIIQPTLGIFTTLGEAHQEHFGSLQEKCEEKLKLFRHTQALIYHADNSVLQSCVAAFPYGGERIDISQNDAHAAFYVRDVEKGEWQSTVHYRYKGEEGCYTLPFIDDASIENSQTCAAAAHYLGVNAERIAEGMARLEPVAMRLEVKEGRHGCTLINDAYNADIHSLEIALDFMARRPDHQGRRRTLILSDIDQSGQVPSELYGAVSRMACQRGVERFIGIGSELSAQRHRIEIADKSFFESVDAFMASPSFARLHDEVILLKGSRRFGFERLTERLVQQVHETTLEVNLDAVTANLNYYRSFMQKDTKLVCMIKADGYGAGAVEIAKTLQDRGADYLAVAVADEGATLRKNGITADIMVMNPELSALETLFDFDLQPEVYSFRLLDALIDAASKAGVSQYPVHIKLDTGMHRLGFDPQHDMSRLIERLKSQNELLIRSVFSHFAGADSNTFDSFSAEQFALFDAGSKQLQAAFSHRILRHIDNSAGILHFPERQLDMCRLGLGLYGIDSRNNAILTNVCTLKTTILQLRHLAAGETVGYSRKGVLTRPSVIAAIPIGYADGLNRRLGNRRCYCLVNGQRAEYVGNICMDVAMIDVTDIACREGDTVEVFGDALPVTVLSDALETIPYEVLTGISQRVKRVYFQD